MSREDSSAPPERRLHCAEGEDLGRVPPALACALLGGLALAIAAAAWLPPLAWLAWFDAPLNVLLAVACAGLALADLRETGRCVPGLLAAAAGALLSLLHPLLDRGHPWVA